MEAAEKSSNQAKSRVQQRPSDLDDVKSRVPGGVPAPRKANPIPPPPLFHEDTAHGALGNGGLRQSSLTKESKLGNLATRQGSGTSKKPESKKSIAVVGSGLNKS